MLNFLAGPFLIWSPKIVYFIFFALGSGFYIFRNRFKFNLKKILGALSLGFIFWRVFEALLKTGLQYYFWSLDSFTKTWTENGYWLDYSFRRFWLNILVSVLVAFIFFLFLKILKRHKERFFEEGEVELGFFAALLSGWPNFLIFLPMTFFLVVVISLTRQILYRKIYTTLGYPFFFALLITLVFGNEVMSLFNLGILRI